MDIELCLQVFIFKASYYYQGQYFTFHFLFSLEDEVNTGIFNLYWSHAFLEPPTDYYLRPYSLRMIQSHNIFGGFCMGPRMSFQVLLDYLEKVLLHLPSSIV